MQAGANKVKAIDLSNLREITRGNKETEKLLFEAFVDTSSKALKNLKNATKDESSIIWKEQAHFLKGAAGNMGAFQLASLCSTAEEGYEMPADQKLSLLEMINKEFLSVRASLAAEA